MKKCVFLAAAFLFAAFSAVSAGAEAMVRLSIRVTMRALL